MFVCDIVKKPPLIFPMVGLFQVFVFAFTIWVNRSAPFPGIEWLQTAWTGVSLICWIGVCDMRKWGGLAYILLTATNIALDAFIKLPIDKDLLVKPFFQVDILFSFFILFYYRRFLWPDNSQI